MKNHAIRGGGNSNFAKKATGWRRAIGVTTSIGRHSVRVTGAGKIAAEHVVRHDAAAKRQALVSSSQQSEQLWSPTKRSGPGTDGLAIPMNRQRSSVSKRGRRAFIDLYSSCCHTWLQRANKIIGWAKGEKSHSTPNASILVSRSIGRIAKISLPVSNTSSPFGPSLRSAVNFSSRSISISAMSLR